MIYGQFQYYSDELQSWFRSITFIKEALSELVRQVAVGIENTASTDPHEKEGGDFIDQFMVQEQQFSHLAGQITSQQQRLEQSTSIVGQVPDDSACQQQNLLRTRMHANERNFVRLKYTCTVFLSTLFENQPSQGNVKKAMRVER
jgi:hypothetical protein